MQARGYTLIELVVAMTISLIGVAAGVTLLVGTQHWFNSGVDDRGLQESGRVALDEISMHVRSAGYGMEPGLAFDTGAQAQTVMDLLSPTDRYQVRFGGYGCAAPPCVRDRVDGPDELVFYERDPRWARDVIAVGANTLSLAAPASTDPEPLLPGQVLQVMCYGKNNGWLWAYVSVQTAIVQPSGEVDVTLAAGPGGSQPLDFPYQDVLLGQSCFLNPSAPPVPTVRAFKIDRYRYHVESIAEDGTVQPWGTVGTRPFLMLDQGLQQLDGTPIDRAVMPDVEDLQVAYLFPMAPAANVLGATLNVPVVAGTGGIEATAGQDLFNLNPQLPFVIPSFGTPPTQIDLARTSHHPANIRAVRIAVSVRTARKDIGNEGRDRGLGDVDTRGTVEFLPAALNRPQIRGESGYRRMMFETTIYTRNLDSKMPVFPAYDQQAYLNQCRIEGCTTEPCARATTGNCGGG